MNTDLLVGCTQPLLIFYLTICSVHHPSTAMAFFTDIIIHTIYILVYKPSSVYLDENGKALTSLGTQFST